MQKTKRTAADIAKKNDMFRTTLIRAKWNRLIFSEAVANSDEDVKQEIITALREYKCPPKGPESNPYGENDFGKFTVRGEDYFFKFDYYHPSMEYGADQYNDEEVVHVLTVMETSEY